MKYVNRAFATRQWRQPHANSEAFLPGHLQGYPHLNRYSCMRTYIPATSDSAAAISSSALPPTSSPLPHLHLPGFCTLCRARSDFRCLALLERPPPSAKRAESCALSAKLCSLAPGGGRSNKAKHGQSDPTRQSEAGRARPTREMQDMYRPNELMHRHTFKQLMQGMLRASRRS